MPNLHGTEKDYALALLRDAEDALGSAIDKFEKVRRYVESCGDKRLAGEIDGYTIGNLQAFYDDDYQMGSVTSIRKGIGECNEEDEDA